MDRNNQFFDKVEKKTNVKKEDIFKLAQTVSNENLRDERTLRRLISQVASLAGVPVSKQKEDQIVSAVINNNVPLDFSTLSKMFENK
ncbi:stage VI sporulation protein F [Fictibacillus sp. WQ 8-8]|uniref:stage VI sporulation protein F n=1 Tax=unclassified Fictibacillus TaxID=2644029 RepID=UPI0006A7975A|nr:MULTISPECIES: stage VI sporulation protein F [unclassified Fictibacillus]MCQ6266040.1 stage VI sporulation protein F [Fictibacillus sp. WQ 8-8]MED2972740.1 stage VI sporulation protein F [Fictibacillus sp. B-59209]UZJ80820.1 stage VI sporulation protein F [Fictibacillus sp. KU28468]SFD73226.1 Stage VI sporulation protein F [Bacillus sp. OV194]